MGGKDEEQREKQNSSSGRIGAGTKDWLPMANGKSCISFSCTHFS